MYLHEEKGQTIKPTLEELHNAARQGWDYDEDGIPDDDDADCYVD